LIQAVPGGTVFYRSFVVMGQDKNGNLMVNLFRTIRRRLLASGKVRSYALYAIGEILLVVIGILIALQVNNWNEDWKNRQQEQEYLVGLREEFQYNKDELEQNIRMTHRNIEALQGLSVLTGPDPTAVEAQKMQQLFVDAFAYIPHFQESPGVLNDLLSSGNLHLIKNQGIRYFISSWEASKNNVLRQESFANDIQDQIMELSYREILFRNMMSSNSLETVGLSRSKFDSRYQKILQNIEFENLVAANLAGRFVLANRYTSLKAEVESFLELIEIEMEIQE